MNLNELYQRVMDARIDLGHAEDFAECCCPKDERRAQRQLRRAQRTLDNALEELNCRLVQLGQGFISSNRSIHIID
jgi:hypothetical protein